MSPQGIPSKAATGTLGSTGAFYTATSVGEPVHTHKGLRCSLPKKPPVLPVWQHRGPDLSPLLEPRHQHGGDTRRRQELAGTAMPTCQRLLPPHVPDGDLLPCAAGQDAIRCGVELQHVHRPPPRAPGSAPHHRACPGRSRAGATPSPAAPGRGGSVPRQASRTRLDAGSARPGLAAFPGFGPCGHQATPHRSSVGSELRATQMGEG